MTYAGIKKFATNQFLLYSSTIFNHNNSIKGNLREIESNLLSYSRLNQIRHELFRKQNYKKNQLTKSQIHMFNSQVQLYYLMKQKCFFGGIIFKIFAGSQ